MNYLELINKCLVELNYKSVSDFTELVKNDHKKIKNIINVLNAEICGYDNWNFLLRSDEITLPAETCEIKNTVNGRIKSLIIDDSVYDYYNDFEAFFTSTQPANTYSIFNDKILLPKFKENKIIKIIYCTKNHAVNSSGVEISEMSAADDSTLIPMPFAEPILVYGSCMRLKGNPEHIRFNYWFSMYKDALANLRSKISVDADETPSVKMHRR